MRAPLFESEINSWLRNSDEQKGFARSNYLLPSMQTRWHEMDTSSPLPAPVGIGNGQDHSLDEKNKKPVKLCPVCGVNPLPPRKSSCSTRCRKRKERLLRKAREESLLYYDK
jgi:predicted nucleic acid-binding Zn ribbon protein